MNSFHKLSFSFWCIIFSLWLNVIVEGAPSYGEDTVDSQLMATTPRSNNRRISIQSVLGRNRGKSAGDIDPQTQNDMRILSLFEHELNKIFSCYVRLSCPRTRSPQVMAECDELKNWPLYHQVMRMAGIKRYPYQNYAPQTSSLNTLVNNNNAGSTLQNRNHVSSEGDEDIVRTRRHQRGNRQRRTHLTAEVPHNQ